ncbi:decreased expression in renal and prostate cancer protein-like isoform X1 [Ambystoma mexicanum]|uniref:decreased expression in renal and prostate cancer protein-like isoform X1 n=1 Tax=Ambystoma mexicanum TaxID=8296 RepID=UPI0037E8F37A
MRTHLQRALFANMNTILYLWVVSAAFAAPAKKAQAPGASSSAEVDIPPVVPMPGAGPMNPLNPLFPVNPMNPMNPVNPMNPMNPLGPEILIPVPVPVPGGPAQGLFPFGQAGGQQATLAQAAGLLAMCGQAAGQPANLPQAAGIQAACGQLAANPANLAQAMGLQGPLGQAGAPQGALGQAAALQTALAQLLGLPATANQGVAAFPANFNQAALAKLLGKKK